MGLTCPRPPATPYWIVSADLHLGANPGALPQRELDAHKSLQHLCHLSISDPCCRGLILLGDVRDTPALRAPELHCLCHTLNTLHRHNRVCLVLMGNHDKTEPNWITALEHPALKDLSDPDVQNQYGLPPETTRAVHFTPIAELPEAIGPLNKTRLLLLHTPIAQLAQCPHKSFDLNNLFELDAKECLVIAGDIHNPADIQIQGPQGRIHAFSPGSPHVIHLNEGARPCPSHDSPLPTPCFQKFVLHLWFENTLPRLARVPVAHRPWYYLRLTRPNPAALQQAVTTISQWTKDMPGLAKLLLPEELIAPTRKALANAHTLMCEIQPLPPGPPETQSITATPDISPLSWNHAKHLLSMLAAEDLSPEALRLMQTIVACEGKTASLKADLTHAWAKWQSS